MITWMQRHKRYLIITIWISTIAFVGAGFVGWGQYSYGDKAGAVAKVGTIEITMGELQKSYSRLFAQYNTMFKGNFDEEKAKTFGLQGQALQQLTNQALLLNLANSYLLRVNDSELLTALQTQEYFFEDGVFNKSVYKETLSRNNLSMKEYETDLRKQLLIQKVLRLFPVQENENEKNIINTVVSIADKLEYKVLSDKNIVVDSSDALVKPFWESRQHDFMSEVSYEVNFIKQAKLSNEYDDTQIEKYYEKNKSHFKDQDNKILALQNAKEKVLQELNAKATKEMALRTYIAYKKKKLDSSIQVNTTTISVSANPFNPEIYEKITALSYTKPYLKPVEIDGQYLSFKLIKINPSKIKTYEDAKESVLPLYKEETKRKLLQKVANASLLNFTGTKSDFITSADSMALTDISLLEANEFLRQLFHSQKKRGIITLRDGKLVLYNILEQKMLDIINEENSITQLKSTMFNEGLIKMLQSKYKTEIFLEGL